MPASFPRKGLGVATALPIDWLSLRAKRGNPPMFMCYEEYHRHRFAVPANEVCLARSHGAHGDVRAAAGIERFCLTTNFVAQPSAATNFASRKKAQKTQKEAVVGAEIGSSEKCAAAHSLSLAKVRQFDNLKVGRHLKRDRAPLILPVSRARYLPILGDN